MTDLPHDPYITAVIDALTTAGLEPTEHWTDAGELDPYRDDDYAGLACMLTAVLVWDGDHPALTDTNAPHGITLLWEHPAEQWQWARRKRNGHLEREPEFLPLPRWADPDAVVDVVRVLLAGLEVPGGEDPRLWLDYVAAGEAVTAWAAAETGE
ncbi:hypothetical protein GTU99_12765 [Streptomyces sp. PRKS01-65]|nr:hypothetical protein [Streptomyces harenosi]NEY33052.1 hypothetical protein [Streptomyces harenosi]